MSKKIHLDFTLPLECAGKRLDQALADQLADYSRANIQTWIKSGQITVNNQTMRNRDKVKGGEQIRLNVELESQSLEPQAIALAIEYEDDDIMVINKPAGLVVHPGAGNPDQTLANALLFHHEQAKHLPRAGIVHRLDKDTSGLMVVAKTLPAQTQLVQAIQNRQVKRHYVAVVNGTFIAGGTVDQPIGRHPKNRLKMAVSQQGKPALTHYRINQVFNKHCVLDIQLETGRTHQIRVHMAYLQHPIIGDTLYGYRPHLPKNCEENLKEQLKQFPRQALHAKSLQFEHPRHQELMTFEVSLAEDIQALIDCLAHHETKS